METITTEKVYNFLVKYKLEDDFKNYVSSFFPNKKYNFIQHANLMRSYYIKMNRLRKECVMTHTPFPPPVKKKEEDKPIKRIKAKETILHFPELENIYINEYSDLVPKLSKLANEKTEHILVVGIGETDKQSRKEILFVKDFTTNGLKKYAYTSYRNIFKDLLNECCLSFIIIHNHPSDKFLTPSKDDIKLTNDCYSLGEKLECPLKEHLIINHLGDYFSFADYNILCVPEEDINKTLDNVFNDKVHIFCEKVRKEKKNG